RGYLFVMGESPLSSWVIVFKRLRNIHQKLLMQLHCFRRERTEAGRAEIIAEAAIDAILTDRHQRPGTQIFLDEPDATERDPLAAKGGLDRHDIGGKGKAWPRQFSLQRRGNATEPLPKGNPMGVEALVIDKVQACYIFRG